MRSELDDRANRFDVVSRLADDLAHEIKNPLNAIVVNLEVLRRRIEAGSTDAALDRVRVIGEELARVGGLVDQMLQLMRPARPLAHALHVSESLEDLCRLFDVQARAARVHFEPSVAADLYAAVQRDALRFSVLNLMAAPYDQPETAERIALSAAADHGDVVIEIRSSNAAFASDHEFVRHARAYAESARGTITTEELRGDGGGSRAVLRIPASSSFAYNE